MIPRSGGQYNFARRALGPYAGFIVGWSDWISTCGTTAAVAIVIGEYTGALLPALAGRTVAVATFVTMAFALLQWRGLRWGSRAQELTAALKTLAFLALVVACFALGGNSHSVAAGPPAHAPAGLGVALAAAVALQGGVFPYQRRGAGLHFCAEIC